MSGGDFFSFLVEETLKLQKSGEAELSSLDLKLNDYSLSYIKGEFIPQTRMLRFITPFGLLDIPSNWSEFDLEYNAKGYHLIDSHNDDQCFMQVLKSAWSLAIEKLVILHADGFCYLIGLKESEEVHLHDILHPQEFLKAA